MISTLMLNIKKIKCSVSKPIWNIKLKLNKKLIKF